jgi:GTP-binding protein Era
MGNTGDCASQRIVGSPGSAYGLFNHSALCYTVRVATKDEISCGYAAVVGRPNVGKSTLLNTILGQKLQIVSAKPQTTRNRVLAVHDTERAQIVFLDTPGLHQPRNSLGRYMVEAADAAIAEADLSAWIVDINRQGREQRLFDDELAIAARLAQTGSPVIALPNKVDLVRDKRQLLPLVEQLAALAGVVEVIPISALEGDGVEQFLAAAVALLPAGPKLFPPDMLSDRAERFFVAELIREALYELTRQEIPYRSAVVVDRFVEETERCVIHATIHVERKSQRGIVVGKGGAMIRQIGTRARAAAQHKLGCPVELRLHVDVSPGWSESMAGLRRMGYE